MPPDTHFPSSGLSPGTASGPILVVETATGAAPDRIAGAIAERAAAPGAVHVGFEALDAALLGRTRPKVVVCPLFTPRFDVIDVLARLDGYGWQGRVCAVSRPLPNPAMVRAEIAAAVPGIPCDLLELP